MASGHPEGAAGAAGSRCRCLCFPQPRVSQAGSHRAAVCMLTDDGSVCMQEQCYWNASLTSACLQLYGQWFEVALSRSLTRRQAAARAAATTQQASRRAVQMPSSRRPPMAQLAARRMAQQQTAAHILAAACFRQSRLQQLRITVEQQTQTAVTAHQRLAGRSTTAWCYPSPL